MSGISTAGDLHAIAKQALGRSDLSLNAQTTAADVPGWDSFKMIEILMEVQTRFGVVLDTDDIDGIKNLGDLQTRIDDKLRL